MEARVEGRLRTDSGRKFVRLPSNGATGSIETDWRTLVSREDIDAVDICAPNDTHAEIALAAIAAGKMVLCGEAAGADGG